MKLELPDEDVEFLFNLVMDAPVPRRRTDRVAYAMAEQMNAHRAALASPVPAEADPPPPEAA